MRLALVELPVRDPAALAPFYGERLGLPVGEEDGALNVQLGASCLRLVPGAPAGRHHVAVNVPEHRLDDAREWLAARVPLLPVAGGDTVHWRAWDAHAVYAVDPDGLVLELIARHRLPSDDASPFGPASLLEISEVGLPTTDVAATVAALEALGLEHWDGDRTRFSAVGDEHGLLIVVPADRPWYPTTDVLGAAGPVRVVLRGAGPAGTVPPAHLTLERAA